MKPLTLERELSLRIFRQKISGYQRVALEDALVELHRQSLDKPLLLMGSRVRLGLWERVKLAIAVVRNG